MPKSKQRASHVRRALRPARALQPWHELDASSLRARRRHAKLAWFGAGLALLVGLYALLGFQLAPGFLRDHMVEFVQEEYGRTLRVGDVRVHPFKLYVELRDLSLSDVDGSPLLALERAFVDLQGPASLWEHAFVFRKIVLERPQLALELRPNGALNLADLTARSEQRQADSEDASAPAVWVQSLAIERGRLVFRDRARREPLERRFDPLSLTLHDFRRDAEGTFGCTVRSEDGARLDWHGVASLAASLRSSGRFTLSNAPLRTLVSYAPDVLPVRVVGGQLALTGTYALELREGVRLGVALSRLTIRELALRAHQGDAALNVATLAVAGVDVRLPENVIDIAQVTVTDLAVEARRERSGALNLSRLLSPASPAAGRAKKTPGSPWTLQLRKVALTAAVGFEDQTLVPPATFQIAPIELSLQGLTLDPSRPIPFTLSARLDRGGAMHARGRVVSAPLAVELDIQLTRLALALAQPYISPHANLTIEDGRLDLRGRLTIGSSVSDLSFAGDLRIDALKTRDRALRQDLVALERLSLEQVRFQLAPPALHIGRASLLRPEARLVLGPRGVLNLVDVFATATARAPPREPAPVARPSVAIDTVTVQDMRVQFSDYVVRPSFSADLQGLRGALRGLSSDPGSRARVALRGQLGRTSPVSIAGTLQPFAPDAHTDLRLRCENVSLPVFNPYSGRFAGYSIEHGDLTTEIHYSVRQRKLEAEHVVRIDQLSWGKATSSKTRAPLPVKLATALLKDRHGVIHLDLPLVGSLDDPAFRVWPLVWQVLKNVVVKAVSAPFDLLGSLFRGAEQAQRVEFEPGVGEPSAPAKAALRALADAMAERPGLRVEVPVGVLPEVDRPALAARARRRANRITDDQLEALGRQRAESIEALLLQGGKVASQRVLISRAKRVSAARGKVRLGLELQ